MDRLSLKWIDGNTNATTPEIPENATFNVDDPSFWTPLSVLSGLASGYCERRAVLNPTFQTGANTSLTWVQDGIDGTARNTIVRNCMHNMALGSDSDHLFYSADAAMYPIGSAATSNYMTVMDSAIVGLIDKNATSQYVPATGATAYADFNDLAVAATNAAASAGSSIQTPEQGGGATLKKKLGIGLPVEWAKERKWMLDELKWAIGADEDADPEFIFASGSTNEVTVPAGSTITYSSGFSAIKDSVEIVQDYTYSSIDGGILTLNRGSSGAFSSNTISAGNSTIIPYAFFIGYSATDSETKPSDSIRVRFDTPQPFMGNSIDYGGYASLKDIIRHDLAKKLPAGETTETLKFGTSKAYIVESGATTTFLAASNTTDLISGYIDSCVVVGGGTYTISNDDSDSSVISNAKIIAGTVLSATCGELIIDEDRSTIANGFKISSSSDAASDATFSTGLTLVGGHLISGKITSTIQAPTETSAGIYKIENCIVSGAKTTEDLRSVLAYGSAAGGNGNSFPYYITALTVSAGGVARIDARDIRGEFLNICKDGTVIPVNSDGTEAKVIIVGGGSYSTPAGIKAMPTVFRSYLVDDKPIVSMSEDYYKRPTLLLGAEPAESQSIGSDDILFKDAADSGNNYAEQRVAITLVNNGLSNCDERQIEDISVSNFYDSAVDVAVFIGKGTKFTKGGVDHRSGGLVRFVAASGGTVAVANSGSGRDHANGSVTIMSGGLLTLPVRLNTVGHGPGIQHLDYWTCLPEGTISISSGEYVPSKLQYDGSWYSRYLAGDTSITNITNTSGTSTIAARACWSSGDVKIYTEEFIPTESSPVYTASNALDSSGKATGVNMNGMKIDEIYNNGLNIGSFNIYSGAAVKTSSANINISYGGLTTENYSAITDCISGCYIDSGLGSATCVGSHKNSDGIYYDWLLTNYSLLTSTPYTSELESVGVLNRGYIISGQSYAPTASYFDIVAATATFTRAIPIFPNGAYVTFNPLAITGTTTGWTSKSVITATEDEEDSDRMLYVYAGSLDSSSAEQAISGASIDFGGVSIQGGDGAQSELSMDQISAVIAGISCYGIDQTARNNHYWSFRCRQFDSASNNEDDNE